MTALRKIAGPRRFLLVGDSKLISYGNKPAAARGRWRVVEDTTSITGPRKKKDPVVPLRRVFVHSTARAHAAQATRANKLDRATGELDRLARRLGSRHYPNAKAVTERITAISRARRVATYLRTEVGADPVTGNPPCVGGSTRPRSTPKQPPTAGTHCSPTSPTRSAPHRYCCATRARRSWNAATARSQARWRWRRCFLNTNRRIAALITVICLALLIFCLIERAVRAAITPQTTMTRPVPGQKAKPTGRLILQALGGLRLIPASSGQPAIIPHPTRSGPACWTWLRSTQLNHHDQPTGHSRNWAHPHLCAKHPASRGRTRCLRGPGGPPSGCRCLRARLGCRSWVGRPGWRPAR